MKEDGRWQGRLEFRISIFLADKFLKAKGDPESLELRGDLAAWSDKAKASSSDSFVGVCEPEEVDLEDAVALGITQQDSARKGLFATFTCWPA